MSDMTKTLAQTIKATTTQVDKAVALLDEGASVPFIARYRKEATGGLDDNQLRLLEERLAYLRELEARREQILKEIDTQGKLTPALRETIITADSKVRLEDLYLPYKPKRQTKAQLAIEAGYEPLASALLTNPTACPETLAKSQNHEDSAAACEGARHIIMEKIAEHADLVQVLRTWFWSNATLTSAINRDKQAKAQKFKDYFDYHESLAKIPSHRALALLRGRREGFLKLSLEVESPSYPIEQIQQFFEFKPPYSPWFEKTLAFTWAIKLMTKLETESMTRLRQEADESAIEVFAHNLKDLLLAAPAGQHITLGLDPGIRTGVKAIVIDATGKILEHCTIYPFAPTNDVQGSLKTLAQLTSTHKVSLIAIGNGTASRETTRLVTTLISRYPDLCLEKVVVNEAGASVYSASAYAAKELPDLDVSIRGAASIARRLQDPLAELVKIEPKAIGVGQYQHDVNQIKLSKTLDNVVEDCVNVVGVNVNTASSALLRYVSGLNEKIATNIVAHRDEHGQFINREQLKNITQFGPKTFEQAAGFLRITDGDNPLDASGVHPEAYPIVQAMLEDKKSDINKIMGNVQIIKNINPKSYISDTHGLPTIQDILSELEKPGRDPRPDFKTATLSADIENMADLKPGLVLEGTVTNVTHFGAFVDVGVHQDGLVHISEMASRFVDDPRKVVKTGEIVKVKVTEVDIARKRISLSMKLDEIKPKTKAKPKKSKPVATPKLQNSAMADALARLKVPQGTNHD